MLAGDCVLPAWQHGGEIIFPALSWQVPLYRFADQIENELAKAKCAVAKARRSGHSLQIVRLGLHVQPAGD